MTSRLSILRNTLEGREALSEEDFLRRVEVLLNLVGLGGRSPGFSESRASSLSCF